MPDQPITDRAPANGEVSGGFDHFDRLPAEVRALVREHGEIDVIKIMRMLPGAEPQALARAMSRQRGLRQAKQLKASEEVLTGVTGGVNE
jgi:hypothetical protein